VDPVAGLQLEQELPHVGLDRARSDDPQAAVPATFILTGLVLGVSGI
jgi:hypothetical protein